MIRVLVWAEDRPLEIARTRMRELYRRGTDPKWPYHRTCLPIGRNRYGRHPHYSLQHGKHKINRIYH